MKGSSWQAILSACDDVDAMVTRTCALPLPATAPPVLTVVGNGALAAAMPGTRSQSVLILAEEVRARILALREELTAEPARDQILLVLVLYLDERVMQMLSTDLCLSWPMLQREWLGSTHGGDELYRILGHVLAMPEPSRALLEVFYFCLNSGFMGRYAGQPAVIEAWKDRLRMAIAAQDDTGHSPQDTRDDGAYLGHEPRSPGWLYFGSVALVLALAVLLVALSNYLP